MYRKSNTACYHTVQHQGVQGILMRHMQLGEMNSSNICIPNVMNTSDKRLQHSCSALPPHTALLQCLLMHMLQIASEIIPLNFPESFILWVLFIIITTFAYSLHPYSFKRYIRTHLSTNLIANFLHLPNSYSLHILSSLPEPCYWCAGEIRLHLLKTEKTSSAHCRGSRHLGY